MTQFTWSSPVSNRMLLESGFSRFQYLWHGFGTAPPDHLDLIPVTEQLAIDGHRANFTYRGIYDPLGFGYAINDANPTNWRASASYVTGAHNVKVGYQGSYQKSLLGREANDTLLRYVFNNGVPRFVGYTLVKDWQQNDRTATAALYVQDQWTVGRLTLQGAMRYDRAWSWAPAEGNGTSGTSPFLSAPVSFPRTVSVEGYNDITTRLDANTQVPNAVIRQLLGRLPGTALPTQNTTVDLLTDGQLYPDERVNQVDMRFAKILRFADRRLDIGVDLYNLFNTNHATNFDSGYDYGVENGGDWLLPTAIVAPRFVRFNLTLSF